MQDCRKIDGTRWEFIDQKVFELSAIGLTARLL